MAACGALALALGALVLARNAKVRLFFRVSLVGLESFLHFSHPFAYLRKRCLDYTLKFARPGDPKDVLRVMDEFATKKMFCINVGPVKGLLLDAAVERPGVMDVLELGCFMGYSAVRSGHIMKQRGGKVTSVEIDPNFAAASTRIIAHAGLADTVTVRVGSSSDVLEALAREGAKFDVIFVDHAKDLYLPDVKSILRLGLLRGPGSRIVCDNAVFPGAPGLKPFVLGEPRLRTIVHKTKVEYCDIDDEVIECELLS